MWGKNSKGERRWYSRIEIIMPVVYGLCFMYAVGIIRMAFDAPVGYDIFGIIGGIAGFGFSIYRFFSKTNQPSLK